MLCYIVYYTDYSPSSEWDPTIMGIFADRDAAIKAVEERYGKKVEDEWDEWACLEEVDTENPFRVTIESFMFFNRLKES